MTLNIQFMTAEKNGVKTGEVDSKGNPKYMYVPDFDEMIKNACCEEEIRAIKDTREMLNKRWFDGFTFQIVYTDYATASVFDHKTGETTFKKKWQVMQFPWYRTYEGVYTSKETMIAEIKQHIWSE